MTKEEFEEICFPPDTAERKKWFTAGSFSHPAKMHLQLQIYLVERYTKPGDLVADVMAGSGTILAACAIGRNVVLVELEDKFVEMQQANWKKIKAKGAMLGYSMGTATILQGDARQLPEVLADVICTSPPYAGQKSRSDNKENLTYTTKRDGKNIGTIMKCGAGDMKNYGDINAIISSPPYEASPIGGGLNTKPPREGHNDQSGRSADTPSQMGAGKYDKPDVICTSPPYEESLGKKHRSPVTNKLEKEKRLPVDYTGLDENIERLRKHGRTNDKAGGTYGQSLGHPYSGDDNNIGNLKSDNYLSAMAQVYQGCFRVLKDGGLLILVTKNFIRDRKIVRLDLDTIKLCEQAGFKLKERLKRKLTQQSFWRTIYAQRFPNAPKLEFEDVLVFEKGLWE